ncbi:hypothetical protein ACLQ24_30215, partial [Micromonospora sp. DT4]|uniref:hypothetical protein n=1 Tax=Micromonospora sp. DT4 TaxID=3393438 RepID=UPI003CF185AA
MTGTALAHALANPPSTARAGMMSASTSAVDPAGALPMITKRHHKSSSGLWWVVYEVPYGRELQEFQQMVAADEQAGLPTLVSFDSGSVQHMPWALSQDMYVVYIDEKLDYILAHQRMPERPLPPADIGEQGPNIAAVIDSID